MGSDRWGTVGGTWNQSTFRCLCRSPQIQKTDRLQRSVLQTDGHVPQKGGGAYLYYNPPPEGAEEPLAWLCEAPILSFNIPWILLLRHVLPCLHRSLPAWLWSEYSASAFTLCCFIWSDENVWPPSSYEKQQIKRKTDVAARKAQAEPYPLLTWFLCVIVTGPCTHTAIKRSVGGAWRARVWPSSVVEKVDSTWEQEEKGNKKRRMHWNEKKPAKKVSLNTVKVGKVSSWGLLFSKDRNISCKKKKKGARRKWEILENKKLLILICQVEELSAAHLRWEP